MPDAPPKCPYDRRLSYLTMEYSIMVDYAALTALMDGVFSAWDTVEDKGCTEEMGNAFEALINQISAMQAWTGWGGIPEKYLGGNDL